MESSNPIKIEISRNEAIVLFEFLGRFNQIENNQIIDDQAEQKVLWNIECLLEKELEEPFKRGYLEILNKARESVRDKE